MNINLMEAVDTLIHVRWCIPVEPAGQVLERCAIAIRDGRVHAVVPQTLAAERFSAREVVERNNHVLLPGFVNAHVETPLALLRSAIELPFNSRMLDAEFVSMGTELALAEMLRGGTTCIFDSFSYPDVRARVCAEARIRTCIGLPIGERSNDWSAAADEALSKGLEVHDEYRDHPLITTAFAIAEHCDEDTLERVGRLANELEMPIGIPLLGTDNDERLVERFERLGLLSPLTVARQVAGLSDAALAAAQRAAINVVHTPQADLRLRRGVARVVDLQAYGLNVACGTAQPFLDLDMLDEIRTAALLAQSLENSADPIDAHEWLRIATLNGAQALGLADACGSIEVGKWADLCCIDLHRPATQPVHDLAEMIVYSAVRDQVSDVWVAGRPALSDGRLTGFDLDDLLARAEQWRSRALGSTALNERRLAELR
jgi:5-methylthioadenosine/S-adenosylhomocysteine deaminase